MKNAEIKKALLHYYVAHVHNGINFSNDWRYIKKCIFAQNKLTESMCGV
jgi:hypothetical protein